jgi:hypothetical protein
VYRLTFDTDVAINAFTDERANDNDETLRSLRAAKLLVEADSNGLIDVKYNAGETARGAEGKIESVRGAWNLGTPGFSELGVSTVLAGDDIGGIASRIRQLFKIELGKEYHQMNKTQKHNVRDYALLIWHINNKRDIFVTEDTRLALKPRIKLKLKQELGIVVMTAESAVAFLHAEGVI